MPVITVLTMPVLIVAFFMPVIIVLTMPVLIVAGRNSGWYVATV